MLELIAIRPTSLPFPTNTLDVIEEQLGRINFAGDVVNDLANYPPAQPWAGRTPRSGPRKGGRRTGTLGRNWRLPESVQTRPRGDGLIVEIANLTPYAVFVEGPPGGPAGQRQTPNMAARNWPNVTDVAQARWAEQQPIIVRILSGRDARLRRSTAR